MNPFLSSRKSQYKRDAGSGSFHFTDRDLEILRALNRYRYMRTGQIHALLFSDNGTLQSARRRLRHLFDHKYIARAKPYVQVGKPAPETTYYLDRKGRALLREEGQVVKYWRKGGDVKYQFLEHAVAISQFRLHLELAVSTVDHVTLGRFIPDFEMRDNAENFAGKKRYELHKDVFHPVLRKSFIVHPDGLIVLNASKDGKTGSKLICLEVDRGTEGLDRIRDKLTGYHLAKENNLFQKYGYFKDFTVLFQAHTQKRAQTIFEALSDHVASDIAWVGCAEDVTSESIVSQPIWKNLKGQSKQVVR